MIATENRAVVLVAGLRNDRRPSSWLPWSASQVSGVTPSSRSSRLRIRRIGAFFCPHPGPARDFAIAGFSSLPHVVPDAERDIVGAMVLQDENVKGWSRMTGAFRGLPRP